MSTPYPYRGAKPADRAAPLRRRDRPRRPGRSAAKGSPTSPAPGRRSRSTAGSPTSRRDCSCAAAGSAPAAACRSRRRTEAPLPRLRGARRGRAGGASRRRPRRAAPADRAHVRELGAGTTRRRRPDDRRRPAPDDALRRDQPAEATGRGRARARPRHGARARPALPQRLPASRGGRRGRAGRGVARRAASTSPRRPAPAKGSSRCAGGACGSRARGQHLAGDLEADILLSKPDLAAGHLLARGHAAWPCAS